MAQIYKEQVREKITPSVPDTGLMSFFEKKRAASVEKLGRISDVLAKRMEKGEKSVGDNLEAKALQIYKNGYDLYNNNPPAYNKFTTGELKKLYATTPDSDIKTRAMAKVALTGSGYDAKVTRRYWDKQEKVANTRFKDATFTSMDSATEGLGSLFSASDNNLTDEQKVEQMQAFKDAQIPLWNAYQSRFKTDNNGNSIFTTAERALIEDKWDNRGSYAVLDYAGENIQTNREGVVALRNRLVEKQDELKKHLGIDDKAYAKTLNDLDKIIKGQTTAHDLKNSQIAQIVNTATVKDMEIAIDEKGVSIGNSKYDNIDTTVAVYRDLQQAEREGAYTDKPDREKLAKEKGKVALAIISQVEDEVGLKDKSATDWLPWGRANVGETAVISLKENISKLETSLIYQDLSDDEQSEMKANMYIEVLGGLQEAEGIELKDKNNPKSIELAKRISTGVYYKQIEALVGRKVVAMNPDDPASVRMAYDNALREYDNTKALAAIRSRLRLKGR